jgi:hypothetical protein
MSGKPEHRETHLPELGAFQFVIVIADPFLFTCNLSIYWGEITRCKQSGMANSMVPSGRITLEARISLTSVNEGLAANIKNEPVGA